MIWVKARGRRRLLRLGLVQAPGQPGAPRPHRAGHRRQQGPLRPGAVRRRSGSRWGCRTEGFVWADDFMEPTLDVWEIPPESATRVGHPAPFPVELPRAADPPLHLRGRPRARPVHGVGLDGWSPRSARAGASSATTPTPATSSWRGGGSPRSATRRASRRAGRSSTGSRPSRPTARTSKHEPCVRARPRRPSPRELLEQTRLPDRPAQRAGARTASTSTSRPSTTGGRWFWFDVSGGFTSSRGGLQRTDTVWKALGRACVLHEAPRRVAGRPPVVPTFRRRAATATRRSVRAGDRPADLRRRARSTTRTATGGCAPTQHGQLDPCRVLSDARPGALAVPSVVVDRRPARRSAGGLRRRGPSSSTGGSRSRWWRDARGRSLRSSRLEQIRADLLEERWGAVVEDGSAAPTTWLDEYESRSWTEPAEVEGRRRRWSSRPLFDDR